MKAVASTRTALSFATRLTVLAVPLMLMGALDQCDVPPPGGCPEIAFVCEADHVPADTDGDGCEDSCVPDATCLAMPVCDEGDFEVESTTGCLQDDAVCYEVSMCGTTIICTGPADPDPAACLDDSECDAGEMCDTENFCDAPPDCGEGADCLAVCYGRCVPQEVCEAFPVCDEGDEEVADSSGCLQDDAACYEVSMCGHTITCTGPRDPEPQACLDDAECGEDQVCDTENFCDAAPECGDDADCIALCYGRCIDDEPVACPAVEIECGEGGTAVDTDDDGCLDDCIYWF